MLWEPTMKKLAILVSLVVATPVLACPHDDASAPKTAEKAKEPAKEAPAKEQPKKEEAKPAETAKAKEQPKKDEPKKPTKVSQK
jgi:hypothetical protein